MNCSELKTELMLYADGVLSERESMAVAQHLEECPLCRETSAELHEIRTSMRQMRRPDISQALKFQLKRSVTDEIKNQRTSWLPVSAEMLHWLHSHVMPYAVGALASVVIGFTFLTLMFSTALNGNGRAFQNDSVMLASNKDPFKRGDSTAISPTDFARTRLDVSSESPSVNPQGALIALTKSFIRGGMKDDEVTVVADVFGNGLAQIAEVVEPSRDSRAVGELEKALASDPRYAPFVAANLDNRSDSVRVVLRFQSVNVRTHLREPKR
jgi:hypothetical protein